MRIIIISLMLFLFTRCGPKNYCKVDCPEGCTEEQIKKVCEE